MQYLVTAMEWIERHPGAPLIISFLFVVPLVLSHWRYNQTRFEINLWLFLPAIVWGVFGCYKLLAPPDIASQVIEIWFVLPALLIASMNALISLGFELFRGTHSSG